MIPRPRPAQDLTVQERPPDPDTLLNRFRQRWPQWGFLHNPAKGEWTALRGTEAHGVTIVRTDPVTLWSAVLEVAPVKAVLVGVLTIPRTAEQAGHARRRIGLMLAAQSTDHTAVDDVGLALGELLANSVQHGAGDRTSIGIWRLDQRVRVEVSDAYTGLIEPASEDPFGETGRGLLMVQAVSDEWAIERTTAGTTAWFEKAIF